MDRTFGTWTATKPGPFDILWFKFVVGGLGSVVCVPGQAGVMACVCNNPNGAGSGCGNTGGPGATISAAGTASLASDATDPGSMTLTGAGMFSGTSCIFLQGDGFVAAGAPFFSGVRCVGGSLIRLYVKTGLAPSGMMTAPVTGDLSISNRSAAQVPSQPISPGTLRYYQIYYRDPQANPGGACPAVNGANVTTAFQILWNS